MASTYFETITSKHALQNHAGYLAPLYHRQQHELPAASGWSAQELFASRVVVHHVRGGVLKHRISRSSSGFLKPPPKQSSAELSKIITQLRPGDEDLTETELIHRLGGTAGMFWAALLQFRRQHAAPVSGPVAADSNTEANSDVSDLEMPDLDDDTQQHPGYIDSSKINVASSSPTSDLYPSSSFTSDNAGHVPREEHAAWAISEDATVQLASTFLRHALVHCPLQHFAAAGTPPQLLLEFSGIRRRMLAHFRDGALELEATADGEVTLLRRNAMGRFVDRGQVLVLLEAKKRFKLVHEGRPVITDNVLGQMVGEALTLRLSLGAAESGYFEDTIVVVAATRQYLCFVSFYIPDAYVRKLHRGNVGNGEDGGPKREDDRDEDGEIECEEGDEGKGWEEEEEVITVRATDWLDLSTEHCRQLACDNIAALVDWQLKKRG
ncbi:hypothetical protein OQA88_9170 [Cercophora sp. LCS_1]